MTQTAQSSAPPAERHSFQVALDDGAMASVRVYGQGPRVIASHGNGLAIDGFRSFWQALANDFETVVFDFRHHGRSSPYTKPVPHIWPQLIRDLDVILAGIARELGPAPSLGAFHSMSGLAALLHASTHTTPWIGLVGFEPPVTPPATHPDFAGFTAANRKLAERSALRRTEFPAVQELVDSFRRSPSFAGVDQDGLQALAESTLRWNADRQLYELACAREFESGVFAMQELDGAWDRICTVKLPVTLVAGQSATSVSPFVGIERALAEQAGFAFTTVQDATHFMQIEKPAECAAIVAAFHASLTG